MDSLFTVKLVNYDPSMKAVRENNQQFKYSGFYYGRVKEFRPDRNHAYELINLIKKWSKSPGWS